MLYLALACRDLLDGHNPAGTKTLFQKIVDESGVVFPCEASVIEDVWIGDEEELWATGHSPQCDQGPVAAGYYRYQPRVVPEQLGWRNVDLVSAPPVG